MGKFVQRRKSGYQQLRLREMSDLDRAASAVLAFNYSRRSSSSPATQGLIQNDCVAVCLVDDEYWIASNSRRLEAEDIDEFAEFLGEDINCWIVINGDGKMHAEMQLLKELIDAGIDTRGMSFGVSKPCCILCARKLYEYGVSYTHYHGDSIVNWEKPD